MDDTAQTISARDTSVAECRRRYSGSAPSHRWRQRQFLRNHDALCNPFVSHARQAKPKTARRRVRFKTTVAQPFRAARGPFGRPEGLRYLRPQSNSEKRS
jgi:hypothetical protein